MRVIPVLDVRGGKAVHARGGAREHYEPVRSVLAEREGDALALARAFRERLGLEELYVADLDAIMGGAAQHSLLAELARASRVMLDAGVASVDDARARAALGPSRVIVGLETLRDFAELERIVQALGSERVAFSIDLRHGEPLGAALSDVGAPAIAARAVAAGVRSAILLDLGRVGAGAGVDLELVRTVRATSGIEELIVGGGVRHRADLEAVARAGADAALVATALHVGALSAADVR